MDDPLQNPRAVWQLHYSQKSIFAKWGVFLCKVFRLKTSGERYFDDLRRIVK